MKNAHEKVRNHSSQNNQGAAVMEIPLNLKGLLLNDAIDSLNEGLFKYQAGTEGDEKAFKFAILHIARFVELMCKYLVADIRACP